jgi:NAD(P)-dependent dehydrogenase (short-subunit alcohol dehydrogenase family)
MRTIVITGANAGIGFATAKFLSANSDCHIVLACRNASKASMAIDSIRRANHKALLSFVHLDLFSFSSIHHCAAELAAMILPPISGLILNAGGLNHNAKSLEFTVDGFERIFQLNFLGHFLFTNLLINQIRDPARIVFVSSDLHDPAATKMGKIMPPRFAPVEQVAYATGAGADLKPMARYATAKMFAMMISYELDRRLRQAKRRITVNSWSPGVVPSTQAGRGMNPVMKMIIVNRWFVEFMGSHLSTEEDAGQGLGSLVLDERYSGVSGRYFDGFKEIPSSKDSRDQAKAAIVWEQSMKLAGIPELLNSLKAAAEKPS